MLGALLLPEGVSGVQDRVRASDSPPGEDREGPPQGASLQEAERADSLRHSHPRERPGTEMGPNSHAVQRDLRCGGQCHLQHRASLSVVIIVWLDPQMGTDGDSGCAPKTR